MRDGSIRNRSGNVYKPSVTRGYEQALERHVLPDLGDHRVADITRADLNRLVERLRAKPSPRKAGATLDDATIRNAILPLRVIYRNALRLDRVHVNPTAGLALSAVRGKRDRVAPPEEAAMLVGTAPEAERALWATAFYAGLRLGELRALRWEDVNLSAGVLSVERSWDPRVGPVAPKSDAGRRTVPIPSELREILSQHRARCGWSQGLAFGRMHDAPFNINGAYSRARKAWSAAHVEAITLHEARHTYASLMIAAGVNAKELATYMGHASITITLDRYGHLFPSAHAASALMLDAFLSRETIERGVSPSPGLPPPP
jgi:integrase